MPESKNVKFVIYGGFGGVNIGDEAIFYSLVRLLESRYGKGVVSSVISGDTPSPSCQRLYEDMGVQYVHKKHIFKVVDCLRNAHLIIGGGQLLNGGRFPKGMLYILFLISMSRILGYKAAILGIGAELIKNRISRFTLNCIISSCHLICCRDTYTFDALSEQHNSEKIKLVGDIVFSGGILALANDDKGKKRDRIVISLHHDLLWKFESSRFSRELIDFVSEKYGKYRVTVIAHDLRDKYDAGFLRDMSFHYDGSSIQFIVPSGLPDAIALYSEAAYVISARMHPLIMGSLLGARPVPVLESNKVKSLFRGITLPGITLEVKEEHRFDAVVASVDNWTGRYDVELADFCRMNKEKALQNLEYLLEVVMVAR